MEPIPSGEVFPNVELTQAEPPAHTEPDHAHCVYYGELQCSHGVQSAAGGFYSEDYIRELKPLIHQLIGFIDKNVETKVVNWSNNARIERKYLHAPEVSDFRDLVEELRMLTK